MPLPLAALLLPSIIGAAGNIFGGAAKGSADERSRENVALADRDKTKSNLYGTQQNALLQSLLASGRDKLSRYEGQQDATTKALQGKQGAWNTALGGESAEKIALAKLGMEAPTANAKASILGSLMKNMTPRTFTSPSRQIGHITDIKGGMSAANLDPLTRQHGDELMKAALAKQLSGGGLPGATNFREGIQDWDKAVLDVPEATDYSKGLLAPPDVSDYKKAGRGESILSGLGTGLSLAGAVGGGIAGARGATGEGGTYTPDMWAGPISEGPATAANVFANANPADLYDDEYQ
jgi:hypothetical protein